MTNISKTSNNTSSSETVACENITVWTLAHLDLSFEASAADLTVLDASLSTQPSHLASCVDGTAGLSKCAMLEAVRLVMNYSHSGVQLVQLEAHLDTSMSLQDQDLVLMVGQCKKRPTHLADNITVPGNS